MRLVGGGISLMFSWVCHLRDSLHGGGGPRVGEVTCDGSPHLSYKCDQIKMRDYNYGQVGYPT